MGIKRRYAVSVVNDNVISVTRAVFGSNDRACLNGVYGRSARGGNVNTVVNAVYDSK